MTALLLLVLPWLSGGAGFVLAEWQFAVPLFYPWPLVAGLALHVGTFMLYGRKRLAWKETLEKMGPSALALAALASSFILVEGMYLRLILSLIFGGLSLLTLKLFFLLCFDRPRYPVNALSHVNLALVPLTAFFMGWGLNGLLVFIQLPPKYAYRLSGAIVLSFILVFAALFGLTSHPTADKSERRRWTIFGAFVGLQIGIMILVLPVGMMVQGAIAALLVAIPIRIRRYGYQPKPPKKLAYFEVIIAIVAFLAILLLARWA